MYGACTYLCHHSGNLHYVLQVYLPFPSQFDVIEIKPTKHACIWTDLH